VVYHSAGLILCSVFFQGPKYFDTEFKKWSSHLLHLLIDMNFSHKIALGSFHVLFHPQLQLKYLIRRTQILKRKFYFSPVVWFWWQAFSCHLIVGNHLIVVNCVT